MRHNGHGVRSVDHLAYCSGMNDWNPGFKVVLSLGTLAICLAADRAVVSLAVIAVLAWLQNVRGGVRLSAYIGLLRAPLVFLLLGGLAVACDISRVPAGDWSLPLPGFYLCTDWDRARFACGLVLKALGAVSAMYLLALTTTACELVSVLHRVRLPSLLTELMLSLIHIYKGQKPAVSAPRVSCAAYGEK